MVEAAAATDEAEKSATSAIALDTLQESVKKNRIAAIVVTELATSQRTAIKAPTSRHVTTATSLDTLLVSAQSQDLEVEAVAVEDPTRLVTTVTKQVILLVTALMEVERATSVASPVISRKIAQKLTEKLI